MAEVLITGASKGIGRAIAVELAKRGHRVVATAREVEAIQDLPVDRHLPLDVTDDASVASAAAAAGPIDVLINNAGSLFVAPVESSPLAEIQRLFEANTFGALRVTQAVLPAMRQRGSGKILFMSSVSGRVALPLTAAYSASKWAVEAFAESLAVEAGHFGIGVTLLEPGAVASGALDAPRSFFTPDDPYMPLASQVSLSAQAMLTVDEVANAVADALEAPELPLRLPIGSSAEQILSLRKSADDSRPFAIPGLQW